MGEVVLIDDHSADQVPRYFKLSAHQTLERDAMRYMFRAIRKSALEDDIHPHHHDIATATIGVIERPYTLFRTYAVDFFYGQTIDHDALSLAVICDSQLFSMRSERGASEDHISHNIDMRIVWRARDIWQGAYHLGNGTDYEDDGATPESLFLAHINLYDDLYEALQFRNEYDADEIAHMTDIEIPNARRFVERGTAIGRDLHQLLDQFEAEFQRKQGHRPQSKQRRAVTLSLVPAPKNP